MQACPNPVSLNIQSTVKPGDISPLLQLPTSCVSLSVGGRAFDDTAAAVVAQPTHLTELKWFSSPGLTDAGLEQLTALTGLHSVNMDGMPGLSEGVSVPSARLVFQNEQPAARMIDISSEVSHCQLPVGLRVTSTFGKHKGTASVCSIATAVAMCNMPYECVCGW